MRGRYLTYTHFARKNMETHWVLAFCKKLLPLVLPSLGIQGTSLVCEQKMHISFVIQPPTDAQILGQTNDHC
jgi:hypothetical protein